MSLRFLRKAPEGAVVLSIDEETAAAIERKALGDRPPRPGVLAARSSQYVRHGPRRSSSLDVHSARPLQPARYPHPSASCCMNRSPWPIPIQPVHVIWDNLNTHCSKVWMEFNENTGNVFTSTSPPNMPLG